MNQITINLSPEDRALLSRIADLLEGASPLTASTADPEPAPEKAQAPADMEGYTMGVPTTQAGPEPAPAVVEAPAPAPAPAPVSLAEFQKAITQRCVESAEVKASVKALINQYAGSVSAVPEDKRAEVLAKLAQI